MRYKQYKLDKWCKVAKIKMIEKDINILDVGKALGFSRAYLTCILNGRYISQKARDKISEILGIQNYYPENTPLNLQIRV